MSRPLVRPLLVAVAGLLAVLAAVGPAAACPFCDGGPAGRNEVYEAIFDESFWPTALSAAVPFAVLLGVAAFVWYGPIARPEPADDQPR